MMAPVAPTGLSQIPPGISPLSTSASSTARCFTPSRLPLQRRLAGGQDLGPQLGLGGLTVPGGRPGSRRQHQREAA